MFIAILSDPIVVGDSSQLFPNVSFPGGVPPSDWLAENNCCPAFNYIDYDYTTQKLVPIDPYYVQADDAVYTVVVEPLTQQEQAAMNANLKANNQAQAISLISQVDWTQTAAVANTANAYYLSNATAFATYIKDLCAIAGNPPTTTPNWPTQPTPSWTAGGAQSGGSVNTNPPIING